MAAWSSEEELFLRKQLRIMNSDITICCVDKKNKLLIVVSPCVRNLQISVVEQPLLFFKQAKWYCYGSKKS